ncbi:hypothetical protein [Streptomyces spongiae]|uniref:hypothetical protein n=1 Tax=Streptomyces spongiae TaxID=565072 RepID=UPI0018840252|nr:hypothetical protein [Streptomyces spongiae]
MAVQFGVSRLVEHEFGPVGVVLLTVAATLVLLGEHARRIHPAWWAAFFLVLLTIQA